MLANKFWKDAARRVEQIRLAADEPSQARLDVMHIGVMEKKMETTRTGFRVKVILGLYWDNGKENGNY